MANSPAWLRLGSASDLVLLVALACGCGGPTVTPSPTGSPLTAAQETATKEYVAVLERQIRVMEDTTAILETVQTDAAGKQAARVKLLHLSLESDAASRAAVEQKPADAAVALVARERVAPRQLQALDKLRAEIRRINSLDGGPDFFEKELQPLSAAFKTR